MNKDAKIIILQLEALCLWLSRIVPNENAELGFVIVALILALISLVGNYK